MKYKFLALYILMVIFLLNKPTWPFEASLKDQFVLIKHNIQQGEVEAINFTDGAKIFRMESNLNNSGNALETDDAYYIVTDHLLLEKYNKAYELQSGFQVTSERYGIRNIQVIGDWLYYTANGVHRVNINGSGEEELFRGGASDLYVTPEWIYFVNYKNNMKLYRMAHNGEALECISNEAIYDLLYDNQVFYANVESENDDAEVDDDLEGSYDIISIDLTGKKQATLLSNTYASGLMIEGDHLYYRSGKERFLYRLTLSSLKIEPMIEVAMTYYAMDADYFYYSTRDEESAYQDDKGLYRVDRKSGESLTLDNTVMRPTGAILLLGEEVLIESDYKKKPFETLIIGPDGTERKYLKGKIES